MANTTERQGVGHCEEIASKNKWLFREQPIDDIGIDATMEMVEISGKPRQLLGVQIKTGSSYFREVDGEDVIFRDIDERQFNYWTMNSLPCIVVLYDPENGICIWQKLTKDTIKRTKNGTGNGFVVRVPTSQVFLDEMSNKWLLQYTNLPDNVANYNFLRSQKKFMQIIQNGGVVRLHSSEWVNKSSGRGDTELIVDDGKTVTKYDYPYWFPFTPYEMVFPKLFPWANFSADEDFFEESDEAEWREYNCYYDNEEDEWLIVGDTFEEYRKKLKPMRYIDHAGEVAEFMMILSLNELGEAFLKVDDFLSEKMPYSDARPADK